MPSPREKSSLKRLRVSSTDDAETKKPRRSARISVGGAAEPVEPVKQGPLPSPITDKGYSVSTDSRGDTRHAPAGYPRPHAEQQRVTPPADPPPPRSLALSSPPSDTQAYSQFLPPPPVVYEVEDEDGEGVWGYLIPSEGFSEPLVLKRRAACPVPLHTSSRPRGKQNPRDKKRFVKEEETYEANKAVSGIPASGYLIGRHPECDRIVNQQTISNRHCLIFAENKTGDTIAVLEDLSGNGTYVNEAYVGRNKRRELQDGDEISIVDEARFIFRYPRQKGKDVNGFKQQYSIQGQLGKGHFATVYLAIEKNSGMQYAVKKFEKRSGPGERSKVEGLQQEIAVLMGVSHPNVLCLKDTFDEVDGVYLILELAPQGELFNWIVMKHKLSEKETRHVFVQLFQGVKYLHERNIVHRDIKPENILLIDQELSVKIADFGLAKIIGEESFTTTLCGTPSYVAPEILQQSNRRRYTRAVDVWSLGVVLYICLCGFPPFSDELYSRENPYTLSQQIKMGRFDYPSPYWDSVGDPALDLIDRMLTVDVDKRITIDDCLQHPWITQNRPIINPNDSTDGLTPALAGLDFSKRKVSRERTMLSSINEVKIEREIETQADGPKVKVFDKNSQPHYYQTQLPLSAEDKQKQKRSAQEGNPNQTAPPGTVERTVEPTPDAARDPQEFLELGGRGDQVLFEEGASRYPGRTVAEEEETDEDEEETFKAGAPPQQAPPASK